MGQDAEIDLSSYEQKSDECTYTTSLNVEIFREVVNMQKCWQIKVR